MDIKYCPLSTNGNSNTKEMRYSCWIYHIPGDNMMHVDPQPHSSSATDTLPWHCGQKSTVHQGCVICLSYPFSYVYLDGLVQERRNSSALAMELRLSCPNPLICISAFQVFTYVRLWQISLFQIRSRGLYDIQIRLDLWHNTHYDGWYFQYACTWNAVQRVITK